MKPIEEVYCFKSENPYSLENLMKKRFKEFTKTGSTEYFEGIELKVILKFIQNYDFYEY